VNNDKEVGMTRYIGVIDGGGDVWGVTLPDIDGCVGAGATPEDAIESVTIALREVAAHARSAGHDLPKPRGLLKIVASGEYGTSPLTALIPLMLDRGRTVRANVTFDAGLLDSIDDEAKLRGLTRSAFLASAARDKIEAGR
jgi:predicted RNase H-like HicB family nuclease